MFFLLVLFAISLPWAFGRPVLSVPQLLKRQDIDTTVLQFALTLEHLENVFYQQGLKNFSQQLFTDFGFDANDMQNLQLIAQDEAQHVRFLTDAITATGSQPVAECTYSFPSTDVASFLTLSTVLEGVGTSAYLGGAPLLSNKDFLTAAGSILVTEALHTSLQRAVVGAVPAANAFGTPLSANAVFTLAASFIVSCPDSNEPLPFTPFASLSTSEQQGCNSSSSQSNQVNMTVSASSTSTPAVAASTATASNPQCSHKNTRASTTQSSQSKAPYTNSTVAATASCGALSAGAPVAFTAASAIPSGSFVTFVSGLTVVSMMGQVNDVSITATIPPGISGQSYVFVTSSDAQGKIDDAAVLFGPAILEVPLSDPDPSS